MVHPSHFYITLLHPHNMAAPVSYGKFGQPIVIIVTAESVVAGIEQSSGALEIIRLATVQAGTASAHSSDAVKLYYKSLAKALMAVAQTAHTRALRAEKAAGVRRPANGATLGQIFKEAWGKVKALYA